MTVSQIAHQVWAEGAKRVAIVSDDPGKYPGKNYFPQGATVHHRRELDRDSTRTARGQRSLRADLRSNLRRRKTPPPQARAVSGSAQARLHQRSRLRRLRRLLADLELRLGSAARNRIRPQAADRSVELQQGLFLRRGILSEFRHRSWRHAEESGDLLGRFRPAIRRPSLAAPGASCKSPTTSSSPASAAPASSRSARCWAWPPISTAAAAPRSTSPASRRRMAP